MRYFLLFLVIGSKVVVSTNDVTCADHQFECDDGKCIRQDWICDGARDCLDGSDETHEACDRHKNKNSPCFGNQPECEKHGAMRCIPHEWLCDGHPDCDKGEDESNCTSIRWFRPPESLMENYQRRYATHSTGQPDYCPYGEFRCANGGECLKRDRVCDGKRDCKDGSDENICTNGKDNNNTLPTSSTLLVANQSHEATSRLLLNTSTLLSTTTSTPSITTTTVKTTTTQTTTPITTTSTTTSTTTKTIPTTQSTTQTSTATPTSTITTPSTTSTSSTTHETTTQKPTTSITTTTFVGLAPHLSKTEPPPTTTLRALIFTSSRSPSTTTVKPPHLLKAIQPPQDLTVLPYTPIMALLFVTGPPPTKANLQSDEPMKLERGYRSSENDTKLEPVHYYKGIPIEPINQNSTLNDE